MALPIVLPAAAVILVGLAAFLLLELVFWTPIRVGTTAKAAIRQQPPGKELNRPTFEWKLS